MSGEEFMKRIGHYDRKWNDETDSYDIIFENPL
jgi:hypothetical protein